MDLICVVLAVGVFAMLVVAYLASGILKESAGTPRMIEIAGYIREATKAFVRRQYKTIAGFIVLLTIPLAIFDYRIAVTFVLGAVTSLLAAYIGLHVAVEANVRTANAAGSSSSRAFALAFSGGAVMGLSVVGLSLIGVGALYLLYQNPTLIVGFGFGASLAALFAQLGGGIFTKAADMGADLVGKIEQHIPEDDPRNPAVIADLVGDNVGDCAGRGSDLFESLSDDYITAIMLGTLLLGRLGITAVAFPLLLGASGILATVIGVFFVRVWKRTGIVVTFNLGLLITAFCCVFGALISCLVTLGDISVFYSVVGGLAASLAVGVVVQYYMGINGRVVRRVAESSERGAAVNVLTGLSYAFQSPFMPILFVLGAIVFAYLITGCSLYGVLGANLGTDLAAGFIMSSDTFGPICDNALGIAKMSRNERCSGSLEELDGLGNTTKAYTKAFATASGTVSTIVIFAAYGEMVKLHEASQGVLNPIFIAGLLLGAALPFIFSSLAIGAAGKTAYQMIDEVRRQFRENPDIIEGKAKPNYARCVDVATKQALKRMMMPGILAVASPVIVGLVLGKYALGAMLLGGLATSALLASFFTFGGGIWDNAKKHVERKFWMRGTPTHEAAVIGDTVGDPLKDVAGPSLNIFMKLTSITALLIAPLLLML
ncbi:sodium-translocating pyrophosphatase [Candidatus Bathyarchaeota archaeon]|nr:sodium-translocating pyrophosphatase [Candidatus Bathyarchaeota archaeon]